MTNTNSTPFTPNLMSHSTDRHVHIVHRVGDTLVKFFLFPECDTKPAVAAVTVDRKDDVPTGARTDMGAFDDEFTTAADAAIIQGF